MGVEYEHKYVATPQQLQQIQDLMPDECQCIQMRTTYFDALDGGLSDRRITLRLRRENDVTVCTLKTPRDDGGRGEWECICDTIDAGIKELCKLDIPVDLAALTACGVTEVCSAAFTRMAYTVCTGEVTLEIALDQGVLRGGGKEIPLCEVEVELKEGIVAAADGFAEDLARGFGLMAESRSKFSRALDLARGEEDGL